MSKKIETYEELLVEKQKMEELFKVQKELVSYEMEDLKNEFAPAFNALYFLKKITQNNSENPALQTGIGMLIDLLSKKITKKNAGYIKKVIIPGVLKKYSSPLLAGYAAKLIQQLFSLLKKKNKGKETN
jgi:hypothetical protein